MPVRCLYGVDAAAPAGVVGDVESQDGAARPREILDRGDLAGGRDGGDAGGGQLQRDRAADAAGAAGDQGDGHEHLLLW